MIDVVTESREDTEALAERIGRVLQGGEVFELVGDVGGGKTTFTKGLARGLAIDDTLQSPTFTISRTYSARDDLELHHFDFYRLTEPGVMAAALTESLGQPNVVVVVEWGDMVHAILPADRATMTIASLDDMVRRFSFQMPQTYSHIVAAVTNHARGQSGV